MSERRFKTIVADPPWDYPEGWPAVSTSPKALLNPRGMSPRSRSALPYGAMSVKEIAAIPVIPLAAEDAHLLLWTTNRYLRDAYGVVEAWGFRPSQLLTWCKPPCGVGPGGVFSNTTEFVVYARRGKPEHRQRLDSTWWEWPRGAHSAKPDAFLDLVEQALPGPYLEMFARRARFGWDYFGDESLQTSRNARGRSMRADQQAGFEGPTLPGAVLSDLEVRSDVRVVLR